VGNGRSHCGLRDVGHGVWVTICGYVTGVRYGAFQDYVTDALRRCVTVRYGCALRCITVRYVYALRCVTLACYGNVLWCVTEVCYGALRCVTLRYVDAFTTQYLDH